jgi:hypothetical protein
MPIRIAMPIAHITSVAGATYDDFYSAGACVSRVVAYFNQGAPRCEGIMLEPDPAAPAPLSLDHWDLFAFTDGFLSLQSNSLVLRLPRELNSPSTVAQFNSGVLFSDVQPKGPQLRHVVYRFRAPPAAADLQDKIQALLSNTAHPMRTIVRIAPASGGATVTLGTFINAAPANLGAVLNDFMSGTRELFVQAADVIGNFSSQPVELCFLDSCGNLRANPSAPGGRSINPAYYLSLLRRAGNAANVTMLTSLPSPPNTIHPLDFLLSPAQVTGANLVPDIGVNLAAATPSRPLHMEVDVRDAANTSIASTGIPIRGLGDWHESRNASNPFDTPAPIRWRLRGNQRSDVTPADFGRVIAEVKPGKGNLLPAAFDLTFAPQPTQTQKVRVYWDRYGFIFNRVSEFYQIPIELLVATACTETSTGNWFNAVFTNSHEMDVIRMEPILREPNVIPASAADRIRLTNYMNLTGGPPPGDRPGANANLPVPWIGTSRIRATNPLTWNDLRDLIDGFPGDVRVSPGVMQALVGTLIGDLNWASEFYGAGFVNTFSIASAGVNLIADNPPATRGAMFEEWFAVSVDATGANTTVAADVDAIQTKMKRALHAIIAGGAHIKRTYNGIYDTKKGPANQICDFDFSTVFSGYNDGANGIPAAGQGSNDDVKWQRLFALLYADRNYPRVAPRYYNAAVSMLNTTAGLTPLPAVRLWKG